jgi:hypothetical protein
MWNAWWGKEVNTVFGGEPKERYCLKDVSVDGRIMVKGM